MPQDLVVGRKSYRDLPTARNAGEGAPGKLVSRRQVVSSVVLLYELPEADLLPDVADDLFFIRQAGDLAV